MTEANSSSRKPRIRKAPLTKREQAEQARAKSEKEKPRRIKKAASAAAAPFRKVKLPRNKATKPVYRAGSVLKRVAKWLFPAYLINSWKELRQVTWPTRSETIRLTIAVGIFAIVFGLLVYGVDKVLDLIFKKVILK